ncbi:hypothetical protein KC946_00030 [Candidatus Saccharibacteria bacterium]|nr:hypothetical protein [Candidatus Saccharibacteria bacterium]
MSRVISQLLNAKEPDFSIAISNLEHKSGNPSVDVSLTSKIQGSVYRKIREIGLDPNDTTDNELYRGLQSMIALHNKFLSDKIGLTEDQSVSKQMSVIIKKIYDLPIPSKSWAIKKSVAKKLLKECPPKKVKSALGYKSLDSMLKREKVENLLTYARICETNTWNKKFIKSYKKLQPSDFENRQIKISVIKNKKLADCYKKYISDKHHNVVVIKEHGVIANLPLPVRNLPGLAITLMPLMLHFINEVRSYSAITKMHQMHPDFSQQLIEITMQDPDNFIRLEGQPIPWKVVQRHYGNKEHLAYPELFEPHIQADDLYWRKAESVLYWIEPALKFWEDLDYVAALYPNSIVPLSLMDNAVSFCNKLEFGSHSTSYFRDSLWNELLLQYLGQSSFEQEIIEQLDGKISETKMVEF